MGLHKKPHLSFADLALDYERSKYQQRCSFGKAAAASTGALHTVSTKPMSDRHTQMDSQTDADNRLTCSLVACHPMTGDRS